MQKLSNRNGLGGTRAHPNKAIAHVHKDRVGSPASPVKGSGAKSFVGNETRADMSGAQGDTTVVRRPKLNTRIKV